MMHLHGFGLSGRYLLPTAEALADEFHTLVPDLPGFGRSGNAIEALTVPELAHAAAAFLDTQGVEKVTLIGNSMGCPVICEFAYSYPDRLERAILVSPAGGIHNQPLPRAVRQLSYDGLREPVRLLRVQSRTICGSVFRALSGCFARSPNIHRWTGCSHWTSQRWSLPEVGTR